jgi:hypothetical protein
MPGLRTRVFWISLCAVACGAREQADGDAATLNAYLSALPEESRLTMDSPSDADNRGALTRLGNSTLALESAKFARDVNTPAVQLVRTLRSIAELPPTLYDSAQREFVWGPWDNEDGVGKALLYIRENEAGADFRYSYALVRTMDGDLAEAKAVIWGAATPDPSSEEKGVGVSLWDIEANNAFDAEHDPAWDASAVHGSGRFVMLYGHEQAEQEAFFNVAVFRNFRPGDAADERVADVVYFYGRVINPDSTRIDFLDAGISADLCDTSAEQCFENDAVADAAEQFGLHAVFVNRGIGRAEATLSGGDLSAGVSMVECWDAAFDRTHVHLESDGQVLADDGACAAPMDRAMDELGLPSLSDIDAELMSKLDCAAEHGVEGCPAASR